MRSPINLGLMAAAAFLAACGGGPKEPDYRAECPQRLVQTVLGNQKALGMIRPGVTRVADLPELGEAARFGTLGREGEVGMVVGFYPTAVPVCPFVPHGEVYTPVIVRPDGVISGYGRESMRELHRQGWMILEAAWPWQSYNYAYLPLD